MAGRIVNDNWGDRPLVIGIIALVSMAGTWAYLLVDRTISMPNRVMTYLRLAFWLGVWVCWFASSAKRTLWGWVLLAAAIASAYVVIGEAGYYVIFSGP
jgi:hypothetical protein